MGETFNSIASAIVRKSLYRRYLTPGITPGFICKQLNVPDDPRVFAAMNELLSALANSDAWQAGVGISAEETTSLILQMLASWEDCEVVNVPEVALYEDRFPTGTTAATLANSWRFCRFNTAIRSAAFVINHNTVAGWFQLLAGTYRIHAKHSCFAVNKTRLGWYDFQLATHVCIGPSAQIGTNVGGIITLDSEFIVANDGDQFQLELYSQSANASGYGLPVNVSGYSENYGSLQLVKL